MKCLRPDCGKAALIDNLCEHHFLMQKMRPLQIEAERAQQIVDTCKANYQRLADRLGQAKRGFGPAPLAANGHSMPRQSLKEHAKFYENVKNVPTEISRSIRVEQSVIAKIERSQPRDTCLDTFKLVSECDCPGGCRSVPMDSSVAKASRQAQTNKQKAGPSLRTGSRQPRNKPFEEA